MEVNEFRELPILGILRGIEADIIEPLVETVVSAGLRAIEITMNTPDAAELIRRMVQSAGDRLTIGAGTVLCMKDLHGALDAGATFIVLPTLASDVVEHCAGHSIPVFPGALTPQEISNAWNAGATMVKVFPASCFGPGYFREIKGPFQDVELLACGGVTAESIQSFFCAGASAVAFGASILRSEWLAARELSLIGESIRKLIAGYHTVPAAPGAARA